MVFGGKPIPVCRKDNFDVFGASEEDKVRYYQIKHVYKWLIVAFTSWTFDKHGTIKTQFEFSNLGLLALMKAWDNFNSSEINKQRFRSIYTIFHKKI